MGFGVHMSLLLSAASGASIQAVTLRLTSCRFPICRCSLSQRLVATVRAFIAAARASFHGTDLPSRLRSPRCFFNFASNSVSTSSSRACLSSSHSDWFCLMAAATSLCSPTVKSVGVHAPPSFKGYHELRSVRLVPRRFMQTSLCETH